MIIMNEISNNNFRYLVLTNEGDEKANRLNSFLNENNYEYEESKDALQLYAEELFNTTEINDHMIKAMVRIPANSISKDSIVDSIIDDISSMVDEGLIVQNAIFEIDRLVEVRKNDI